MGHRFQELEGARAGLALWVVASHLLLRAGFSAPDLAWPASVIREGSIAVQAFMILSGFVIAHLLLTRPEPYGAYLVRRFLRLFPVLCVCVVSVLALGWLSGGRIFRFDDDLPYHLLAHAAMLHSVVPTPWLPNASTALIPPAWSVSLEWQFYLVAPALLYALRRSRWALAALVAMLCAVHRVTGFEGDFSLLGWELSYPHRELLPLSLPYFLVGMLCRLALPALRDRSASVAGVVLTTCLVWLFTRDTALSLWALVLPAAAGRVPGVSAALAWRPLRHLGAISYSIYLSHIVVIKTIERSLAPDGLERGTWELLAFLAATSVPATLAVSHLLHRFVEQPTIRLGRRWTEKREPARHSPAPGDAPDALPAAG